MTRSDSAQRSSEMPDVLVSWDRLGFRLLVFGTLALMWMLQVRLAGASWSEAVFTEFGGLMPWAFLAPWVIALNRRIRRGRPGAVRYMSSHVVGMILVYPPYWLILRCILFLWKWGDSGWASPPIVVFVPTVQNVARWFLSVPFVYFLILLGAEGMAEAESRREQAAQADRMARQLSDARLALLQRQLHPHFLFNALQAISTLLHRDPVTADRLLVRLSELLRAMLDEASAETLPLRTELDLVRKYLEIEQARFGARLDVEWRVDADVHDIPVPSLLVLPLVENAIRHGLAPKVGSGRLSVGARRDGASLHLTVEDDGLGASIPLPDGLGVRNSRQRLEAIYGGRAALDVDTAPQRGFRARIRIPLELEQERA